MSPDKNYFLDIYELDLDGIPLQLHSMAYRFTGLLRTILKAENIHRTLDMLTLDGIESASLFINGRCIQMGVMTPDKIAIIEASYALSDPTGDC